MKDGTESNAIWSLIDDRKLKDRLHELFEAYHRMRFDAQKQLMAVVNESSGAAAIVADKEEFPMINRLGSLSVIPCCNLWFMILFLYRIKLMLVY
jgi:hypothetical protein